VKNVEVVNARFLDYLKTKSDCVVYGQNVNAGSRIGGLAKNIDSIERVKVINSTNSENTLAGFGFGLLLSGKSSCYVLKQHDFMLLGMDHWRNTWNMIRTREFRANYVIIAPVVDSGFEGPQANLNNLSEFASIFSCPVYVVNSTSAIDKVFTSVDSTPLSIVGLSQKSLKSDVDVTEEHVDMGNMYSVIEIKAKPFNLKSPTHFIVCLGFSWNNVSKILKDSTSTCRLQILIPHMIGEITYIDYLRKTFQLSDKITVLDDSYSSFGEGSYQKQLIENVIGIKVDLIKINFQDQLTRPDSQDFKEVNEFLAEMARS
jgi:hypothetical protein